MSWWEQAISPVGEHGEVICPPQLAELANNIHTGALTGMVVYGYREYSRIRAEISLPTSQQHRGLQSLDPNTRKLYFATRFCQRAAAGAIAFGSLTACYCTTRLVLSDPPKAGWPEYEVPQASALAAALSGSLVGLSVPGRLFAKLGYSASLGVAGAAAGWAQAKVEEPLLEAMHSLDQSLNAQLGLPQPEPRSQQGKLEVSAREDPAEIMARLEEEQLAKRRAYFEKQIEARRREGDK